MDFSATSIWTMTKLFVRDPGAAARLVFAADIPLNVSILMIVLSAVMSSFFSGIQMQFVESPRGIVALADGNNVEIIMGGPLEQAILAVIMGLSFGYAVFRIGKPFGGVGSFATILSAIAVLQIISVVFEGAVFAAFFILPFTTLFIWMFGLFVMIRGLVFSVDIGHELGAVAKAAFVVFLAGLSAVVAVGFIAGLTGIGFDLELVV